MIPTVHVACGVLQRDDRVLLAQRPVGKIAAGWWEFPGGKIETNEAPLAALKRELWEELGVSVQQASPLITVRHRYRDRAVVLHTWLVTAWQGEVQGLEQQALAWWSLHRLYQHSLWSGADPETRLLPTVAPIARRLWVGDGPYVWRTAWPNQLGSQQGLLRLRGLDPSQAPDGFWHRRPAALRLITDHFHPQAQGLHLNRHALKQQAALGQRPVPVDHLLLASVHDLVEMQWAEQVGVDAVVLSPILPTASHPQHLGLGWEVFAAWVAQTRLPVFALGGMKAEHQAQAQALGGAGIAGLSAFSD